MIRDTPEALARRAEAALIGGLIAQPSGVADVLDLVSAEDFHGHDTRAVFVAILAAREAEGDAADLLALERALLRARSRVSIHDLVALQVAGGLVCQSRVHARIVREQAEARRLRAALAATLNGLVSGATDAGDAVAEVRAAARVAEDRLADGAPAGQAALLDRFEVAAVAAASGARVRFAPSVHPLLDAVLPPATAREMLVIGGRPGSGKSHLVGDLAYGWARAGVESVVLSAEDDPEKWAAREAAKVAREAGASLDLDALRAGSASPRDWTAWREARAQIEPLPVRVESIAGRRACEVATRMRLAASRGARVAVVDYVQIVRPSSSRFADSVAAMDSIIEELLGAAIETGLALVVVSQLRRLPPGARELRPTLGDLRGSGMIEARARMVVFLWRYSAKDYSLVRVIREKWTDGGPAEAHVRWLPHERRVWPVVEPRRSVGAGDDEGPPF